MNDCARLFPYDSCDNCLTGMFRQTRYDYGIVLGELIRGDKIHG
jgi:hypothetical protein